MQRSEPPTHERPTPGASAPRPQPVQRTLGRFELADALVRRFLGRIGVPALRVSLGLVFLWFGALKVFDVSPVADLLTTTVYWMNPAFVVPALGTFEMFVGACLLLGRLLRLTLALFALQMAGTFLVFVLLPEVAFQRGNPLLLTVEGEFVVKNLVLFSAGIVVGSRVRRLRAPGARRAALRAA